MKINITGKKAIRFADVNIGDIFYNIFDKQIYLKVWKLNKAATIAVNLYTNEVVNISGDTAGCQVINGELKVTGDNIIDKNEVVDD